MRQGISPDLNWAPKNWWNWACNCSGLCVRSYPNHTGWIMALDVPKSKLMGPMGQVGTVPIGCWPETLHLFKICGTHSKKLPHMGNWPMSCNVMMCYSYKDYKCLPNSYMSLAQVTHILNVSATCGSLGYTRMSCDQHFPIALVVKLTGGARDISA